MEEINLASKKFREHVLHERLANIVIENDELKVPNQMEQIRADEVKNNAGGFVFPVSDEIRVRRFIILGCTEGTYYSTEKKMTLDNAQAIIEIIEKGKGDVVLREILNVSLAGRNPKQEPLILALALCARYQIVDVKKTIMKDPSIDATRLEYIQSLHKVAMTMVKDVCRIPTHLFMFVNFCEIVSKVTAPESNTSTGWGRLMRTTIAEWYASKTPQQLAVHLTKYRQRDGWSHRDIFRLAHPIPKDHEQKEQHMLEIEQLYRFAVKGNLQVRKRKLTKQEWDEQEPEKKYTAVALENEMQSSALNLVEAFLKMDAKTPEEEVIKAIKEHGLVREHIPTEHLNSVGIWQALLDHMPMTAMIRNLGKLSAINALNEHYIQLIVDNLTNVEKLQKAKIHPITVLMAKAVYEAGKGEKGKLEWPVNQKINDALEESFYKSFINAPPTGKRFCFAFDVSGSMTSNISGLSVCCRTISAALSLVSLKNESKYECVGFCDTLVTLPYDGTWDIKRIWAHMDALDFGNTDCALPMIWAKEQKKEFDVFVIYTDCETWCGEIHPFQALRDYREASGITDAKLIVMGMTATGFTIADPTDAGMLDIVGFDSAVPQLINEFVTGQL